MRMLLWSRQHHERAQTPGRAVCVNARTRKAICPSLRLPSPFPLWKTPSANREQT
jgi:hypothetical protein